MELLLAARCLKCSTVLRRNHLDLLKENCRYKRLDPEFVRANLPSKNDAVSTPFDLKKVRKQTKLVEFASSFSSVPIRHF